jgi:hypothetical protein
MKAKHVGLGVRYGGRCLVCGQATGSRPWELAQTSLYKLENGKFGVAHPRCAGGQTKSRVGGGTAYRVEPQDEIEIQQQEP